MAKDAAYDIVIHGASGFTGRLVAEVLASRAVAEGIRWAMSGRSLDRLAAVRAEIGAPDGTPLIAADAADGASLGALAHQAKVIVTTVGPYQTYGSPLVAACAAAGTDYLDLCGEPTWMREMIDAHAAEAKRSGARIVFSCGFDSIPFDLGVFVLQKAAKARFGVPATRVRGRVRKMKGTFSGGTAASLKATLVAAAGDARVRGLLRSSFALTPGFEGPPQPSGLKPELDPAIGAWVAPFIMAPINTKNIHRSNLLLGHPYGRDFVYDEMVVTGPGEKGEAIARAIAADRSMASGDGPKPGEGPGKAEREAGFYDLVFLGETADGRTISASVTGDRDPGYGSTSKMIGEAAFCLLRDMPDLPGGIYTPAAAMGEKLVARLKAHAGLTFDIAKD